MPERFYWSAPGRLERLKVGYEAGELAKVIAADIGCTPRQVVKKASELGYSAGRSPEAEAAHKAAIGELSRATNARRWARRRPSAPAQAATQPQTVHPPPPPLTRGELDRLVAEAVAAGKVTVLPPGQACGLSRWEQALKTAPPPPSADADYQANASARGKRAAAKTRFFHANQVRRSA